jgi:hypothetical protein
MLCRPLSSGLPTHVVGQADATRPVGIRGLPVTVSVMFPTDNHMGAALRYPEFRDVTEPLAREFGFWEVGLRWGCHG